MRRWIPVSLAVLLAVGLVGSAWANEEMHPAGRLFYPLWDTSTASRLTFIIITRLNLNDANQPARVGTTSFWTNLNKFDNCRPRGPSLSGGSSTFDPTGVGNLVNQNRLDLDGTATVPVFVDDVHIEYYGRDCTSADETIHMSCADIDLLLLSQATPQRKGYASVASQGVGAVDVHLVLNQGGKNNRKLENSLMGHGVISDTAEGWAATYPAAAAKATTCSLCTGGSTVGYEPYPLETYLPFSLADGFPAGGDGKLTNFLALWAPGFQPGGAVGPVNLDMTWWDGRERPFFASSGEHAVLESLSSLSSTEFNVSNFTCGHTAGGPAENDGFPRTGTGTSCTTPLLAADLEHDSDNFETGAQLQSSTPIGWWRFKRSSQGPPPLFHTNLQFDGKGLVGVVLSSTPGSPSGITGVADAVRLWHKGPCEKDTHGSLVNLGPPHLMHRFAQGNEIVFFNTVSITNQQSICTVDGNPVPPL